MRKLVYTILGAMGVVMTSPVAALAAEGGAGQSGMIAIGAAVAIAGAAIGAGLGQGRAVAAAMESIGRNPNAAERIQTPMIIGIAFMEALAIYALVIAFFLQGKI